MRNPRLSDYQSYFLAFSQVPLTHILRSALTGTWFGEGSGQVLMKSSQSTLGPVVVGLCNTAAL